MTDGRVVLRPLSLAVILIVGGAVGWYAAFRLALDKFEVLRNPTVDLDCNLSVLVQCGKNLDSWQGAVFGFPNPLLGVAGFVAPIAVGVGLLAHASFARWFWVSFNIGVALALGFCIWLVYQSIFVLGTLCPWCMVVWAAAIAVFWSLTLHNVRSGVFGATASRTGGSLYSWVPAITVGNYLIVAIAAQLRLDVIATL